jgi:hypothetical protein
MTGFKRRGLRVTLRVCPGAHDSDTGHKAASRPVSQSSLRLSGLIPPKVGGMGGIFPYPQAYGTILILPLETSSGAKHYI